ncbi:unnamed protein product [Rhodiola kirilowii]
MGLLGRSYKSIELSHSIHQHYLLRRSSIFMGKRFASFEGSLDRLDTKTMLTNVRLARGCLRASASRKAVKKLRKRQSEAMLEINKDMPDEPEMNVPVRKEDTVQVDEVSLLENKASRLDKMPSRENVLQACIVTSSLMAALGVTIRQVSHIALVEGLPVFDCSLEPSFSFEIWHMQLIAGLVVLVSSCRYLLLNLWPEFEESSQAANQQILTSLEPLDYILVAFLPGFSEELLFRGGLLPLFGYNSLSALAVGTLFGILHLGNGRKYSFTIWATFVGFVYGYATIASSSIIVPMAAHGLNNLVGGDDDADDDDVDDDDDDEDGDGGDDDDDDDDYDDDDDDDEGNMMMMVMMMVMMMIKGIFVPNNISFILFPPLGYTDPDLHSWLTWLRSAIMMDGSRIRAPSHKLRSASSSPKSSIAMAMAAMSDQRAAVFNDRDALPWHVLGKVVRIDDKAEFRLLTFRQLLGFMLSARVNLSSSNPTNLKNISKLADTNSHHTPAKLEAAVFACHDVLKEAYGRRLPRDQIRHAVTKKEGFGNVGLVDHALSLMRIHIFIKVGRYIIIAHGSSSKTTEFSLKEIYDVYSDVHILYDKVLMGY